MDCYVKWGNYVGHIYMEREEDAKIKLLDAFWVHEEHMTKSVYLEKLWET
jgi:hypothetical protein